MEQIPLLLAGFIFGLFWFKVLVIPLFHGLPRTIFHVLRGRLRRRALLYHPGFVVFWAGVMMLAWFVLSLALPGAAEGLASSGAFFLGQFAGAGVGAARSLTRKARHDLELDLWEMMDRKGLTLAGGKAKDEWEEEEEEKEDIPA